MRRLAIGLVVLAACSNDPDEIFTYSGLLLAPDRQTPLDGQRMELLRSTDTRCTEFETWRHPVADDGGRWSERVFRGELQGAYLSEGDNGRCLLPQVTFPFGAKTELRINTMETTSEVPPLFAWQTGLSVFDGGVIFTPIETPEGTEALDADAGALGCGVSHHVLVTAQDVTLWVASDVVRNASRDAGSRPVREPMTLPSWLLEDFDATVTIEAREARWIVSESASLTGSRRVATVERFFAPKDLALQGQFVPSSRGLSCRPLADPCPLTDGRLAAVPVDAGVLDFSLPRPAFLVRVVLRQSTGVTGPPVVTLFDDAGATLATPVATLEFGVFTPAGLPEATRIRGVPGAADGGTGDAVVPLFSWLLSGAVPASRVRLSFPGRIVSAGELTLIE